MDEMRRDFQVDSEEKDRRILALEQRLNTYDIEKGKQLEELARIDKVLKDYQNKIEETRKILDVIVEKNKKREEE